MHNIDFPLSFFSFPLNVILALIWAGGAVWLWKRHGKSIFVRMMLSKWASISAITLFLIFCLVVGLTGARELVYTWPSVVFLLYFQTVLLFVILRGWKSSGGVRWRFLLNHVGLLIAMAAAFWGAPDTQTLRVQVFRDAPSDLAYTMDGMKVTLPYEVSLTDFDVETFETQILIDGQCAYLKVNDPYARTLAEDIYVASYDQNGYGGQPGYCVLQIVRQPWKYAMVAGIVMMLCGALCMFTAGPARKVKEDD